MEIRINLEELASLAAGLTDVAGAEQNHYGLWTFRLKFWAYERQCYSLRRGQLGKRQFQGMCMGENKIFL